MTPYPTDNNRLRADEQHMRELNAALGDLAMRIENVSADYFTAYSTYEKALQSLKQSQLEYETWVAMERSVQVSRYNVDRRFAGTKNSSAAVYTPTSCMTAGSAPEREKEFEQYIATAKTQKESDGYSVAQELLNSEREVLNAKMRLEGERTRRASLEKVAEITVARLQSHSTFLVAQMQLLVQQLLLESQEKLGSVSQSLNENLKGKSE